MRLFFSGLRKLVRRPATWVTVGLLIGLLVLIFVAVGATANSRSVRTNGEAGKLLLTFPGAYDRILQFITGLGGLFAVIYGAAIAGSEWSWGTLKGAVARGESRVRYTLMTYVTVAVMIGFGLLLTFAVGILAAIVGAHLANVSTSGLTDSATLSGLPERLGRGWFAIIEEGALGFTIATLARSQLAGIGMGIAFYFGEGFASLFLPDQVKFLPFSVANASLATASTTSGGGGAFSGGASSLPADQALFFVAVWLIGALIVAALFADRAEITG
jgi:ABC-type transport system involved in multi-copper enzyme maturation permease subunit